jgi:hypothetical protein
MALKTSGSCFVPAACGLQQNLGRAGDTIIIWFITSCRSGPALIWPPGSRQPPAPEGPGFFKVTIFMPNNITAATIGMLFMSFFAYPSARSHLYPDYVIANAPNDIFPRWPGAGPDFLYSGVMWCGTP